VVVQLSFSYVRNLGRNKFIVTKIYLSTIVDFPSQEAYDLFPKWSRDKQIIVREKMNKDQNVI